METLKFWLKFSLVAALSLSSILANAQNNENDSILKYIKNYESTKNTRELFSLRIVGKDNEIALSWFEKNMSHDEEVFHIAALAFSESSAHKWNSKAESMLLRSLKIRPNSYVAIKIGHIYLNSDKSKACDFFRQAHEILPTGIGNEQYAFCLMPAFDDRTHRKSETDACAIIKSMADEYWRVFQNIPLWDAGRVYLINADCMLNNKMSSNKNANLSESVEWLRRGMINNHEYSAFLYAEHLENGLGALRDAKGAIDAYTKSASLGLNIAQNRLGVIHAEGKLVSRNLIEAYKWFLIASANGYEAAKDNRIRAESRLSRAEIRSAESSAKQWLKENPQ